MTPVTPKLEIVIPKLEQEEKKEDTPQQSPTLPNPPILSKRQSLGNPQRLERFASEVAKFEQHVQSLNKKTLATSTPLEKEWKELNEYQEKQASQKTISVARCYSSKNRFADLLPFDDSRIVLEPRRGHNDYINASNLGRFFDEQPGFIVAQAPLASSANELYDFWSMVVQQQVELLVCLCRDSELASINKSTIYWPTDKQNPLIVQTFIINLVSLKRTSSSIQRVCTVEDKSENLMRTVTVLQMIGGEAVGPHELPENIPTFLKLVKECEHFYLNEQRKASHPILVSCLSGVSRSAVFILVYCVINVIETNNEKRISPDCITRVVKMMRNKRKFMVHSMMHLKYAYDAVLYYLKDVLIREGVLTNCSLNQVEAATAPNEPKPIPKPILNSPEKETQKTDPVPVLTPEQIEKPTSIIDLCDPGKFTLENTEDAAKKKNKITKNDFLNYGTRQRVSASSNDPFGSLDPFAK